MKILVLTFCLCIVYLVASEETNVKRDPRLPRLKRRIYSQQELQEVETRIFGGSLARDSQFPYQALLSYNDEPYCGASIIHERWSLTARHCILENETETATLTIGTIRFDGLGGQIISVELFIPYPEYMYKTKEENNGIEFVLHDIGLIRFEQEIFFSSKVQPIGLPAPKVHLLGGKMGVIAGWGKTKTSSNSDILLTARVRVLHQPRCRIYWPYVRDLHLCTSIVEGKSVCFGDSGGALVIDNRQYGIISTANDNCTWPKPNLYTDVSAYVWWILQETEKFGDHISFR